jgi:RNA polymerase sigma-70 factor (ECF subfamily)
MPDEPEALGLLALMLLHESRRAARTGPSGELVLLEQQDRTLWDRALIREGEDLLDRAIRLGRPGAYQLQAAIAALHSAAPTPDQTDWAQIAALYRSLGARTPSPVVELNRAVAVAMADGPAAGLPLVEQVAATGVLDGYPYLHATRADLLGRLGRREEAAAAFRRARELTANAAEQAFLDRRLAELQSPPGH